MNRRTIVAVVGIAAALGAFTPRVARAEDPLQRIIALNKKALEDYDILEFESAKKALLEAINVSKKGGADNHPVTARTYVHLGIVYINGFKDRFKGFQQFQKAIQIQGDIKLDKNLSTPELTEVFESALEDARSKGQVGPPQSKLAKIPPAGGAAAGGKKPVTAGVEDEAAAMLKGTTPAAAAKAPPPKPAGKKPSGDEEEEEDVAPKSKRTATASTAAPKAPKKVEIEEPDLPASINVGLLCPNSDEAPPEKDIALRCATGPGVNAQKVFLFYRPAGKEDFVPIPMVQSKKGWWNGAIPASVVTGKSLQYYMEAKDRGGKPLASNGRADSPELMIIREGAKVVGTGATDILKLQKEVEKSPDLEIEENPLEAKDPAAAPKVVLGAVKREVVRPHREIGDARLLWAGIEVGAGAGFSFGGKPEYRKADLTAPTGVAPAIPGGANLEVGYYLNPQLAVALQTRHQYIDQPTGSGAATGAHAFFAKALYFVTTGRARFFGTAQAGVGIGRQYKPDAAFRLIIHPDSQNLTFKDTVGGGPFAAGVGAGWAYELTYMWSFVAEARALVGAPRLASVLDLAVGMQFVL